MRTLRPASRSSTAATFVDVITVPVTVSPLWKTGSLSVTATIWGGALAGSEIGVGSGVGIGPGLGDADGEGLGLALGLGVTPGEAVGVTTGPALGVSAGDALGVTAGDALGTGEGGGVCATTTDGRSVSAAADQTIVAKKRLNM